MSSQQTGLIWGEGEGERGKSRASSPSLDPVAPHAPQNSFEGVLVSVLAVPMPLFHPIPRAYPWSFQYNCFLKNANELFIL